MSSVLTVIEISEWESIKCCPTIYRKQDLYEDIMHGFVDSEH